MTKIKVSVKTKLKFFTFSSFKFFFQLLKLKLTKIVITTIKQTSHFIHINKTQIPLLTRTFCKSDYNSILRIKTENEK